MARVAIVFFFLTVGVVRGQFTNLVAPGSGTDLYFSVAQPLKASGEAQQDRLFAIGTTPLTVLLEGPTPIVPPKPPFAEESAWFVSGYYRFPRLDFSRDRSVMATTAVRDCYGGYGCLSVEPCQTTVADKVFPGQGWLSGNGRYLITNSCQQYGTYIIDLQTGQQWPGPATRPVTTGRIISDNGIAIINSNGILYIVRGGQRAIVPFAQTGGAGDAIIDAGGQTILYDTHPPSLSARSIRMSRTNTAEDTLLLASNGDTYAPWTGDGSTAMFLSTAQPGTTDAPGLTQLYSVSLAPAGSATHRITNDPAGVLTYAASDDGQVAWYLSGSGRLVKLDVVTGNSVEEIPSTPQGITISSGISPGSALRLAGAGIATANLQVNIAGISAPILSASPTNILIQVPWEVPAAAPSNPVSVSVAVIMQAPQSPFETTFRQDSQAYTANPILITPAIHGDWSGFVTPDKPALPGEVLNFYATGLGPVQPAIATGMPGPSNPPAQTTTAFSCNATVLYSGLAPGVVGYYQFTLRLPSDGLSTMFYLNCGAPGLTLIIPVKQ